MINLTFKIVQAESKMITDRSEMLVFYRVRHIQASLSTPIEIGEQPKLSTFWWLERMNKALLVIVFVWLTE